MFVFFLVSGFALSIQYLSSNDPRLLVKIAAGRYARLSIPIFAACLVVHIAMVTGIVSQPHDRLKAFQWIAAFEPTIGHLFKFALIDVFFDYQNSLTYIGPLWTMSLELMGSILVLGTIAVLGPFRWRVLFLAIVAGVLIISESMMALFVVGAVLAECFQRGWLNLIPRWVGVACLAGGCLAPFFLLWRADAWNMISVSLLTLGCIRLDGVRAWLSTPLSRHLGKISFPLYLIHGPVMLIVGAPLMQRFYQGDPAVGLGVGVAVVGLSVVAAYALAPVNDLAIKVSRQMGDIAVAPLFKKTADSRADLPSRS